MRTSIFTIFFICLFSCVTPRNTHLLLDDEWRRLSNEAASQLMLPYSHFDSSGNQYKCYLWPKIIYYASLPSVIDIGAGYPSDLIVDKRSLDGFWLQAPDSTSKRINLYHKKRFYCDTVPVMIVSPLLKSGQKNVYYVRQYIFWDIDQQYRHVAEINHRFYVSTDHKVSPVELIKSFDFWEKSDISTVIDRNKYCNCND